MQDIKGQLVSEIMLDQHSKTAVEFQMLSPVADNEESEVKWPPSERNPAGRNFRPSMLGVRMEKSDLGFIRLTPEQTAEVIDAVSSFTP